jgi:hypothetical protein
VKTDSGRGKRKSKARNLTVTLDVRAGNSRTAAEICARLARPEKYGTEIGTKNLPWQRNENHQQQKMKNLVQLAVQKQKKGKRIALTKYKIDFFPLKFNKFITDQQRSPFSLPLLIIRMNTSSWLTLSKLGSANKNRRSSKELYSSRIIFIALKKD